MQLIRLSKMKSSYNPFNQFLEPPRTNIDCSRLSEQTMSRTGTSTPGPCWNSGSVDPWVPVSGRGCSRRLRPNMYLALSLDRPSVNEANRRAPRRRAESWSASCATLTCSTFHTNVPVDQITRRPAWFRLCPSFSFVPCTSFANETATGFAILSRNGPRCFGDTVCVQVSKIEIFDRDFLISVWWEMRGVWEEVWKRLMTNLEEDGNFLWWIWLRVYWSLGFWWYFMVDLRT